MKAIINNLTEQAIEVDFGTERVYRDLAKDKPDIINMSLGIFDETDDFYIQLFKKLIDLFA